MKVTMKMSDKGMGGHQSAAMKHDEWLTPPNILNCLGTFDLDPCAPITRPWEIAKNHYTSADDGLRLPWSGRVWLNPPYGRNIAKWMMRMAEDNHGIALIFARTETAAWNDWIWPYAAAFLFIRGRVFFYRNNGEKAGANSGAPSVLIAYGSEDADILKNCGIQGRFIKNTNANQT